MANIDLEAIREEVNHELSRVEESYTAVEERITELEMIRDRNQDLQSSLTEYVEALENLANAMDEVENIISDTEELGIY